MALAPFCEPMCRTADRRRGEPVLTPAMFRNRSYDCQQLAERSPNTRVRDILLDMARTWTRLALEAEEWRHENSPRSRLAKKDATKDRFRSLVRNPYRPLDQQLDGSPISTKSNRMGES